ncbi:dehydrogenases with different specificities [Candidatus Scalindua japonica]|uniref:Dehydrogenases with different specificities n=1 Tax=Candidatus Scalindua japonica TaxID=1284222 RepID=A0A286U2N1_9BACT|nr:SDR family oxidoreductase [Candidatus Scalindua japonica]GAX62394.1 dehydrogenases with different specificities [Candidatus Scalindua japonica]
MKNRKYTLQNIQECIVTLETLVKDSKQLASLSSHEKKRLFTAAGKIARPSTEERKKRRKDEKIAKKQGLKKADRIARRNTGIRDARRKEVFSAPKELPMDRIELELKPEELSSGRNCYVCKAEFTTLHHFYDSMCKSCGDLNYRKRFQTASLNGKVALITGSRLKIGYHATLKLLRAGATVIATTRFPVDSAERFEKEEDFVDWKGRLHIHGLDLRHTPSVEIFASYIEQSYDRLDILINNAAQTVRRPPGFYAHLIENESKQLDGLSEDVQCLLGDFEACKSQLTVLCRNGTEQSASLPVTWHGQGPGIGLRASASLSQIPYKFDNSIVAADVFPKGKFDVDLQQVDLRKTNSWRLKLGEIETPEMLEVQLVNAVAPFVLCNRLANLMKRNNTGQKHIVNVTAVEGKFYRFKKSDRHPHTNMAKAALNMLTHTSAGDFAKYGIFMNAVDTGWVTDEDPTELSQFKQKVHDFEPPLDIVDGAARVCDPFFDGILTGKHWVGKFLKDYFPIDW